MTDYNTMSFDEAAKRVTEAFKEYTRVLEANRPYRIVKEADTKVKQVINDWSSKQPRRRARIQAHYERLCKSYFS